MNLSRRQFHSIAIAGAAALSTVARPRRLHAAAGPLPLVAQRGTASLLEDASIKTPIWGYSGTVPGREIRTQQGEVFAAAFENALTEATTVHWHGIRNDNAMDGVANMTQPPVPPGEGFAYRFTPPDAGTFWYHPHNRTWEQMARGLYGAFIVEEVKPPAVDTDRVMIIDDWRLNDDGTIDEASFGAIHDMAHAGRLGNVITVNGKPVEDIEVAAGERLRLRLINAANARIMGVQFEGHAPVVVALDGMPVSPFLPDANVVVLAPSQRADVILDCTGGPGDRTPINIQVGRETLHLGDLVYKPKLRKRPGVLSDLFVLPDNPMPTNIDLDNAQPVDLVMEGGAMGGMRSAKFKGKTYDLRELAQTHGKVWAFNGEAGMTEKPIAHFAPGKTAVVRIVNQTGWPHAMHFHGHHVLEVAHTGRSPLPHWRDTVLVEPRETVSVAFVAHNPGMWMLHCHMLEHQAGGMATWYEVG